MSNIHYICTIVIYGTLQPYDAIYMCRHFFKPGKGHSCDLINIFESKECTLSVVRQVLGNLQPCTCTRLFICRGMHSYTFLNRIIVNEIYRSLNLAIILAECVCL